MSYNRRRGCGPGGPVTERESFMVSSLIGMSGINSLKCGGEYHLRVEFKVLVSDLEFRLVFQICG